MARASRTELLAQGLYHTTHISLFSKTYTMIGNSAVKGLIPLASEDMFQVKRERTDLKVSIRMSYLEIYNEHLRDLLTVRSEALDIAEDPSRGVIVPGLSEKEVTTASQVGSLLRQGQMRRSTAPTGANEVSSRSHAVIIFTVVAKADGKDPTSAKLSMVDLAGSERAAATENRGIRMQEGANINRSLLALSNCINALGDMASRGKRSFVPYRDSKLTRLLKDSLGGNTITMMVANVPPSASYFEEILNTLKYAYRAKCIKKQIKRNDVLQHTTPAQYAAIIGSLKREIERLKAGGAAGPRGNGVMVDLSDIPTRPVAAIDAERTEAASAVLEAERLVTEARREAEEATEAAHDDTSRARFDQLSRELLDNFQTVLSLRYHIAQDDRLLADKRRRLEEIAHDPATRNSADGRQMRLELNAHITELEQTRTHKVGRLEAEESKREHLQTELHSMKTSTRDEVLTLQVKLGDAAVRARLSQLDAAKAKQAKLTAELGAAKVAERVQLAVKDHTSPPIVRQTDPVSPTRAAPAPPIETPATAPVKSTRPTHVAPTPTATINLGGRPSVTRAMHSQPARPTYTSRYSAVTPTTYTSQRKTVSSGVYSTPAAHTSHSHTGAGAGSHARYTSATISSQAKSRPISAAPYRTPTTQTTGGRHRPVSASVRSGLGATPSDRYATRPPPTASGIGAGSGGGYQSRESRLTLLHRMAQSTNPTTSYSSRQMAGTNPAQPRASAFSPTIGRTGLDRDLQSKWTALQQSHKALGYNGAK